MKKVILFCSLLVLITGYGNKTILEDDYVVNTSGKMNCDHQAEFYYSDGEKTVYLVCLEEVTLIDKNGDMTLREFFEHYDTVEVPMDRFTSPLLIEEQLFDGGTRIYKDDPEKQYTSDGITVIRCQTMEKNKDYYIGPKDLKLEDIKDGYCGKKVLK
ncbi:MAG: hypothetical protein HFH09_03810 [Bacilli bacterium]|nr:hypothetical protein [Bacilli bacterium]